MKDDEILKHFRKTKALLDGHFVLSSGLHSKEYLQCALALSEPTDAARFGLAIAEKFDGKKFDIIASPAIGGLIIGYEVAKSLGLPFIWTERAHGKMTVRRGFEIAEAQRILVVEDVVTTGGSVRECVEALKSRGADVVHAATIIDRSGGKADVGVPLITSLVELDVPVFLAEECPMCHEGIQTAKPGSR